jgi:hypothetical protein
MVEIAEAARGPGRQAPNGDWRIGANDGLVIHRSHFWHDFAAGKGDHGAASLLEHLGGDASAWLSRSGDGRLGRGDGHDEEADQSLADAGRVAFVEALWTSARPIAESPIALTYFAGRGLDPISVGADSQLRWLDDFRGEEGAILARVANNGDALVALQITHIRPDGSKSDVQPVRKLFRGPHDWRGRGVFRLGSAGVDLVMVEGVEDAIAARMAGAERVHACLGVASMGRAELPIDVSTVIVAREGDPPGSPASLQLGCGVARLMLQGRDVKLTPRAGSIAKGAKDVADLVRQDVGLGGALLAGADLLKDRLDNGERDAFLDAISRAETDAYEQHRKAVAAALNWRAGTLDDDRNRRWRMRAKANEAETGGRNFVDFEPWSDPVTDIGEVLDDAVAELRRFLVLAHSAYYDVSALWSAHTHLLHHDHLDVSVTSRIAFQSPVHRCGKSTALKCVFLLSHKGRMTGSISPAALFRAIEDDGVSLMIDEADRLFKHFNNDMISILNSGIDRLTAYATRTVPSGERDYKSRNFSTFTGIAYTSIGPLPVIEQQDRVIAIWLNRAKKSERPERLDVETRQGLIAIGRRFKRWALDLPVPKIGRSAHMHNRIEDKWRALFQVAKLAGPAWFERCGRAAAIFREHEANSDASGGGARNSDLLADVWQAFHDAKRVALHTSELCRTLNTMDESPWPTANNGRQVNGYFLRDNLGGFLAENPEKIAPRKFTANGEQAWGYHEKHFQDAFELYLDKDLPSKTDHTTKSSDGAKASSTPPSDAGLDPKPSDYPSKKPENDDKSACYHNTVLKNHLDKIRAVRIAPII